METVSFDDLCQSTSYDIILKKTKSEQREKNFDLSFMVEPLILHQSSYKKKLIFFVHTKCVQFGPGLCEQFMCVNNLKSLGNYEHLGNYVLNVNVNVISML